MLRPRLLEALSECRDHIHRRLELVLRRQHPHMALPESHDWSVGGARSSGRIIMASTDMFELDRVIYIAEQLLLRRQIPDVIPQLAHIPLDWNLLRGRRHFRRHFRCLLRQASQIS